MLNQFLRTQRLFHREDMEKLYQGRVAGGVVLAALANLVSLMMDGGAGQA